MTKVILRDMDESELPPIYDTISNVADLFEEWSYNAVEIVKAFKYRNIPFKNLNAKVPCNGCTKCCEDPSMEVKLESMERMDKRFTYKKNGKRYIKRQKNGHCLFLTNGKCRIYYKRPISCRIFDCRKYSVMRIWPRDGVTNKKWDIPRWKLDMKTDKDYIYWIAHRVVYNNLFDSEAYITMPWEMYVYITFKKYLYSAEKIYTAQKDFVQKSISTFKITDI